MEAVADSAGLKPSAYVRSHLSLDGQVNDAYGALAIGDIVGRAIIEMG